MAAVAGNIKYLTTPLPPIINRGLELAKLRAQENNLRLNERQRIGRDGCVQAILFQFLQLPEHVQDEWIDQGVKALIEKQ